MPAVMTIADLLFALIALVVLLIAYQMWLAYRGHSRRLSSLEHAYRLEKVEESRFASLAMADQITANRWSWRGHQMSLGLYSCSGASTDEEISQCVAEIIFASSRCAVYLGQYPSQVAREVLRRGIEDRDDPRGRLAMPRTLAELEAWLRQERLGTPWIVCDDSSLAEDLGALAHRLPCGVILFNAPEGLDRYSSITSQLNQ